MLQLLKVVDFFFLKGHLIIFEEGHSSFDKSCSTKFPKLGLYSTWYFEVKIIRHGCCYTRLICIIRWVIIFMSHYYYRWWQIIVSYNAHSISLVYIYIVLVHSVAHIFSSSLSIIFSSWFNIRKRSNMQVTESGLSCNNIPIYIEFWRKHYCECRGRKGIEHLWVFLINWFSYCEIVLYVSKVEIFECKG